MSLAVQLSEGLNHLGIALPSGASKRMLDYVGLLEKWNKVYNLTAIREPARMVSHHLLDSLAVVPHLVQDTIVDVGSGAGLPGIPLALARPDVHVTLLEASSKKAAFLRQTVSDLEIANAAVCSERAEQFRPAQRFGLAISRAFAELSEYLRLTEHLTIPGGVFAAMKGLYPFEEIDQLPAGFTCDKVVRLDVPGVEAERHLVLITRQRGALAEDPSSR